jgi:hypothetical protein
MIDKLNHLSKKVRLTGDCEKIAQSIIENEKKSSLRKKIIYKKDDNI